ncbi:hypothetical protein Hanom_Chr15g01377921 [Helianthus anomalus]
MLLYVSRFSQDLSSQLKIGAIEDHTHASRFLQMLTEKISSLELGSPRITIEVPALRLETTYPLKQKLLHFCQ